jgi:hypothetical protein
MTIAYNSEQRNSAVDEFITPEGLIRACVHVIAKLITPTRILEPGANTGQWGKVLREVFPYAFITGIEIMDIPKPEWYDDWIVGDFLTYNPGIDFDLVIGNPPYSCYLSGKRQTVALSFVKHSLELLSGGFLGFLLNTNFRHPAKHVELFKQHRPIVIGDCVGRPSYYKADKRTKTYGKANTNAYNYAFFVWQMGYSKEYNHEFSLEWGY